MCMAQRPASAARLPSRFTPGWQKMLISPAIAAGTNDGTPVGEVNREGSPRVKILKPRHRRLPRQ
jgi:hypothetical protein